MNTYQFKTHKGEIVNAQKAFAKVADDWRAIGEAIRKENLYAQHVTEERKEQNLQTMIAQSEKIRAGNVTSFTIWQRINTEITGECVALLN